MEGNRRPSFKKRPNAFFKKGGNKRGKFGEQTSERPQASETVYRILCQSRKIGNVIGKGGGIVKALREETQAKITVANSVPGSEERVIIIYSLSTKMPVKHDTNEDYEDVGLEKNDMELRCAAQDALLKVHDKIVEEDVFGGTENGDNENVVIARLLVPNNMVGCLLGKKGDVIQRLRSETGASIRVLPTDQLPACAMSTDELVQISAKPAVAKRALYEVSTLLHQNPRKDKPPSGFLMSVGGQGFYPHVPSMENIPPANLMRPEHGLNAHAAPSLPWLGGYGSESSRFRPDGFDGDRGAAHSEETPTEFSMKILCSAAKIGGVIGKGGSKVRQLQQETGTSIHVDDASVESDVRVIRVSSFEAAWNPRSRTIDAILLLQDKTSDHNEKGIITTRLLIPSSKVGCILGQGGQVINEMRRRTKADIRVYSKEEKPKCAGEDEELVQVSGNYGIAKDALAEIASRFRARCLRDAKSGTEPAPVGPIPGFAPRGNLPGKGPSPSGAIQNGRSGGYEPLKGGGREFEPLSYPAPPRDYEQFSDSAPPRHYEPHSFPPLPRNYEPHSFPTLPKDYEPRSFPAPQKEYEPHGHLVPPRTSGYPGAVDVKMASIGQASGMGSGVHNASEVTGTRLKLQDPNAGGAEPVAEMRGSSQHLNATLGVDAYQGYTGSGGQNCLLPISYHGNYGPQQGAFSDINSSSHASYHSTNPNPPYPPQQGHYSESSYQY